LGGSWGGEGLFTEKAGGAYKRGLEEGERAREGRKRQRKWKMRERETYRERLEMFFPYRWRLRHSHHIGNKSDAAEQREERLNAAVGGVVVGDELSDRLGGLDNWRGDKKTEEECSFFCLFLSLPLLLHSSFQVRKVAVRSAEFASSTNVKQHESSQALAGAAAITWGSPSLSKNAPISIRRSSSFVRSSLLSGLPSPHGAPPCVAKEDCKRSREWFPSSWGCFACVCNFFRRSVQYWQMITDAVGPTEKEGT
jgi:hypothetical protein